MGESGEGRQENFCLPCALVNIGGLGALLGVCSISKSWGGTDERMRGNGTCPHAIGLGCELPQGGVGKRRMVSFE
jgi:hypothetical protein